MTAMDQGCLGRIAVPWLLPRIILNAKLNIYQARPPPLEPIDAGQ